MGLTHLGSEASNFKSRYSILFKYVLFYRVIYRFRPLLKFYHLSAQSIEKFRYVQSQTKIPERVLIIQLKMPFFKLLGLFSNFKIKTYISDLF